MAALITGGVLAGGLLLGGTLVSAQTPDDTPTVESSQTPSDTTTPSVTPQDQTPSTTPDQTTPDDGSATPQNGQKGDHECDMDGDGQPDTGMQRGNSGTPGGTSFSGMNSRMAFRQ
jgi:hypothetical protein